MAKKKPATKKGAAGKGRAPAKEGGGKKAAPARKSAAAAKKTAPARRRRAAAKKVPARLTAPVGDEAGPAGASNTRLVMLVMTKSDPDTMSTSGDVFSNTGKEASDVRVRRTLSAQLQLRPGPHKYVFKIEGSGSLTLEARYPDGKTMSASMEFKSNIPIGRVYDFVVQS